MSKDFIIPSYTFTPGVSGAGTVDLSGIVGFNIKKLVAIINQTKGQMIYATGKIGFRYTNVSGTLITLFYDTSAMSSADVLQVVYQDDNIEGATENGKVIVIGGSTSGGVVKAFEVNESGHLNVSDGGGSLTVDNANIDTPLSTLATSSGQTTTNTKLDTLTAKFPGTATAPLMQDAPAQPVRLVPQIKNRITFSKSISNGVDTSFFSLLQTGAGMTVNQTGGNLVITSGTNTNSETIIRSLSSYKDAQSIRWTSILSQRIANQNFIVEAVDIIGDDLSFVINSATSITVTIPSNPFTSENVGQSLILQELTGTAGTIPGRYAIASVSGNNVTFTVAGFPASGSGTVSLVGWNYVQARYQGTTATNVTIETQRRGYNTGSNNFTATINTTASPGHLGEMVLEDGEFSFFDNFQNLATNLIMTQRVLSFQSLPDQDVSLFLQIKVLNGSTAPASASTWTIGMIQQLSWGGGQKVTISGVSNQARSGSVPVVLTTNPGVNLVQVNSQTATELIQQASTTNRGLGVAPMAPTRNNVVEVASAAITTTGNGTAITSAAGISMSAVVGVTAVSGTTPTLDQILQMSFDEGTSWIDVWHVERMTAISSSFVPMLPMTGRRRWNHVISGTTPSFTRQITTMLCSHPAKYSYQYFDRTANVLNGTLNANTASYFIQGAMRINARITLGAATTAGTYRVQVSDDGTNWSNVGTATVAVANATTTIIVTDVCARFARLIVTGAATAQTGTVVSICATE